MNFFAGPIRLLHGLATAPGAQAAALANGTATLLALGSPSRINALYDDETIQTHPVHRRRR
jgi:hypothetical protein